MLVILGKAAECQPNVSFEQEDPKIGTQNCSTKRGVLEPLFAELALNDKEFVEIEVVEKRVFEQMAPLKRTK